MSVPERELGLRHLVQLRWGVRIPLRDGVTLSATLYESRGAAGPTPVICTLTPYTAQRYHEEGVYFAARGYRFVIVDVRGRGNSEGEFRPNLQEARDGYDVVTWLASQPYCNGQVAMWGASYMGHAQWATASQRPPALATIVPAASPHMGSDFPMRNNIWTPYVMQWLTLVAGRTLQEGVFWNQETFWGSLFRDFIQSGRPFRELDTYVGVPAPIFQEWIAHPRRDSYWDQYNPTTDQYRHIDLPVLTITGIYDGDQWGALTHYRLHLANASSEARSKHFLVIGPWDHAGTRTPRARFSGIETGPEALIDLRDLHRQWYDWTLQDGAKPVFFKRNVAYYVMGLEAWRYADSLEDITQAVTPLYLSSSRNPTDAFRSGQLSTEIPKTADPAFYVYDPRDTSLASLESTVDPESLTDQRMLLAASGPRQLVYHTAPFGADREVSGFFRALLWLSIDQPDTDVRVLVYEIDLEGRSVLLTSDLLRTRYRESLEAETLVSTRNPLPYEFARFTFVARHIRRGCRLRLVIGPIDSIYSQRNYNGGGCVAEEGGPDARVVTVTLLQDARHSSALYVPWGRVEAQ